MASTRNKNTSLDYNLERKVSENMQQHNLYIHSSNGRPISECMPSVGYIPSHMSRDALANNSIDIESALYGIGSCNLVNSCQKVDPSLKNINFKEFFDRSNEVIMPPPMAFNNNQRPTL